MHLLDRSSMVLPGRALQHLRNCPTVNLQDLHHLRDHTCGCTIQHIPKHTCGCAWAYVRHQNSPARWRAIGRFATPQARPLFHCTSTHMAACFLKVRRCDLWAPHARIVRGETQAEFLEYGNQRTIEALPAQRIQHTLGQQEEFPACGWRNW